MPSPRPASDPIDPAALAAVGLASVEVLAETGSTMERARELALDPTCAMPAVVIADRQTAGRGRRGAHWWQPPGSLAASLVLEATPSAAPATWSLACGVALAETLRELEPTIAARVRWPNDVEVDGRKLAGILVEAVASGRVVFGIGVNTTGSAAAAPPALARRVATMPDLAGRPLPRGRLLAAFVPRFRGLLAAITADPQALAARYRPLCGLEGRFVALHVGPERHAGICRGIAASGALVLDTAAGRRQFVSGSLTDPADVWRGDG